MKNGTNGSGLPHLKSNGKFKSPKTLPPHTVQSSLYNRYVRRVVTLTLLGLSPREIGAQVGLKPTTIRNWLSRPGTQELLNQYQLEYDAQTEKQYTRLFKKSVNRIESIVERGDAELALDAIKTIWKAKGLLHEGRPNAGIEALNIYNQQQAVIGANPIEGRTQAAAALEWLRTQTRETVIPAGATEIKE